MCAQDISIEQFVSNNRGAIRLAPEKVISTATCQQHTAPALSHECRNRFVPAGKAVKGIGQSGERRSIQAQRDPLVAFMY